MTSEGKQSRFTFKNIALTGAGIFFTSWAIPKLLDHYLDTTLLTTMQGWLLGVWNWALLDTPMPNWSLVMIIVVLISTMCLAIYYYRLTDAAYDELYDAEKAVYDFNNPKFPLTELQTKLLLALAHYADTGAVAAVGPVCAYIKLSKLQVETGLEQLEVKGFVKRTVFRGILASTTFELTLAGKEYVLERYTPAITV
jgi:hypothetical protein